MSETLTAIDPATVLASGPAPRRRSVGVRVGSGKGAVTVGGGGPIVVQSMTNTDTADVDATVAQVAALARAGSELVRITVDRDEAAAAVPHIREKLDADGRRRAAHRRFPLYRPQAARRSSGLRRGARRNIASIPAMSASRTSATRSSPRSIECAIKHGKAVRIGANWGSLDQELLTTADGRERQFAAPARRRRGDARGDGAIGAALGRAGRRDRPRAATASSSRPKSPPCRI